MKTKSEPIENIARLIPHQTFGKEDGCENTTDESTKLGHDDP